MRSVSMTKDDSETVLSHDALEDLRRGNPAARSLPLLRQVALAESGSITLPYLDDRLLRVDVEPCR